MREWLRSLDREDRKVIGKDIKTVEIGWPLGMPLVRSLGDGLWEVRSRLRNGVARVVFLARDDMMVLLHGFVWRVLVVSVDRMQSWVRPGMVVTYTNEDLDLDHQPCQVSSWSMDDGGALLLLTICEDPARDRRAT